MITIFRSGVKETFGVWEQAVAPLGGACGSDMASSAQDC